MVGDGYYLLACSLSPSLVVILSNQLLMLVIDFLSPSLSPFFARDQEFSPSKLVSPEIITAINHQPSEWYPSTCWLRFASYTPLASIPAGFSMEIMMNHDKPDSDFIHHT